MISEVNWHVPFPDFLIGAFRLCYFWGAGSWSFNTKRNSMAGCNTFPKFLCDIFLLHNQTNYIVNLKIDILIYGPDAFGYFKSTSYWKTRKLLVNCDNSLVSDFSCRSSHVPRKRCSGNMQQVYRRTPITKCDFNKVALQLYWNHTSAWVFSCKFAAFFQNTFY